MKKRKLGGAPGGGQIGSERRIEVIVKMQKNVGGPVKGGSGRGLGWMYTLN